MTLEIRESKVLSMTKTTQELVADAAAKHGLTPQQILGHNRRRDIVRARWEAWKAARDQGWTLSKIASEFNRDHTTILHGLRALDDPAGRIDHLKAALERIAKPEAFYVATSIDPEAYARMIYADCILNDMTLEAARAKAEYETRQRYDLRKG